MKAAEYIYNALSVLSEEIPNISFRYQHNQGSNTHVVEVLPFQTYNESEEYMEWEADFTDEFEEQFQNEEILFVSEESLIKVSNPEFVIDNKWTILDFIMPESIIVDTPPISVEVVNDNDGYCNYALAA